MVDELQAQPLHTSTMLERAQRNILENSKGMQTEESQFNIGSPIRMMSFKFKKEKGVQVNMKPNQSVSP